MRTVTRVKLDAPRGMRVKRRRRKGPWYAQPKQRCRRCGCTAERITERCVERSAGIGCMWAEDDLCTACLTPSEKKVFEKYRNLNLYSDRNFVPQIIAAIRLQIQTLKDSFTDQVGDRKGYPDTPEHASEIECLEEAIQMALMVLVCWIASAADGVHGYQDLHRFMRIGEKVISWRLPAGATNQVWILQSSADGRHWADVGTNAVGNIVFAGPTNGLGFFRLKGVAQ